MSERKTILIAGVTGMLGHQIASVLLGRGDCSVQALIRPGGYDDDKGAKLEQLRSRGLKTVEGDLTVPKTLLPACEGVDTVISAVQGGEKVVVTGQTNLIEAAETAGVTRMIPSDFSIDLHKLDYNDHVWLAMRKRADDAFKGKSVKPTSVLIGAFMDVAIDPILGLVNWDEGYFTYWGDGEQPCDFTAVADTAKYIAAAALDDGLTGRSLRVAGEVLTMKQLHSIFEEFAGCKLELRNPGSVDELKELIENKKRENPEAQAAYVFYQYQWAMVSGKAKLDELDNERYPDIKPMSMRDFLSHKPPSKTSGPLIN